MNSICNSIRDLDPNGSTIKVIANIPIVSDIVLRVKYYQISKDFNEAFANFKGSRDVFSSEKRCVTNVNNLRNLSNSFSQWGRIQRVSLLFIVLFATPTFLPNFIVAGMFIYPFISMGHCMINSILTQSKQSEFSKAQLDKMRAATNKH